MSKLKLGAIKDGKDKNRYCGPSVISALTKLTTGEAARLIRNLCDRKFITGTDTHEVRRALGACNITMQRQHYPGLNRTTGPTLAAWLRMSKEDRTPGRVFLIVAGWHWQLISGRRYTCGMVREIISIRDKRVKRRARVAEVHELISDNVKTPEPRLWSKPKSKSNPGYYQIKKLIKQYPDYGLKYERDDINYWVYMSDELENRAHELGDELGDEHYCSDIEEVYDRFCRMVEFGKRHHQERVVNQ